jgi:hypothetical protein
MRKRIAVVCCFGLFFAVGWAFGQQSLSASKWSEYGNVDKLARTMYLQGYLDGFEDGDSAMERITFPLLGNKLQDPTTKKLVGQQLRHVADVVGLGKNSNITVADIENATTAFYSDYRNAPVCWRDAFQFSVWSLSSDAPNEQELNSARKRGAESSCK